MSSIEAIQSRTKILFALIFLIKIVSQSFIFLYSFEFLTWNLLLKRWLCTRSMDVKIKPLTMHARTKYSYMHTYTNTLQSNYSNQMKIQIIFILNWNSISNSRVRQIPFFLRKCFKKKLLNISSNFCFLFEITILPVNNGK